MNRFSTLDKTRLYAMIKDINTIFHFIIDSDNNIRILTGHMKGYIIEPVNQNMFHDADFTVIDIGEAPTVATIKVNTAKGRPRTPE